MKIIDTPWNTSSKLTCLSNNGITTVIRYYNFSNSSALPQKKLLLAEAEDISLAGLSIAVVFQQRQNKITDFSYVKGMAAGKEAYNYARDHIGQPDGSAIYFAVDFDASKSELNASIIPYFEGVQEAFLLASGGSPSYRVGAYGSGLVCTTLKKKNLISLIWLSMSRGFRGTRAALSNGEYDLNQIPPAKQLCRIGVDYNEQNPAVSDFGQFTLDDARSQDGDSATFIGTRYKVIARRGLRLREGPGLQFEIDDVLQSGEIVYVTDINNGWASVDKEGDGNLDGFASAAYLQAI